MGKKLDVLVEDSMNPKRDQYISIYDIFIPIAQNFEDVLFLMVKNWHPHNARIS